MTDLYCSHGPVSSMPGSLHDLPAGTMCDTHADVQAVKRLQTETDSFGCEYACLCQPCLDQHRVYAAARLAEERHCDWCRGLKTGVRDHRDMDEGMSGPVYQVCGECRSKEAAAAAEELASMDDGADDCYDPTDRMPWGPNHPDWDPEEDN